MPRFGSWLIVLACGMGLRGYMRGYTRVWVGMREYAAVCLGKREYMREYAGVGAGMYASVRE